MKTVALLGAGAVGAYFIWGMSPYLGDDFCVIAHGERKERLERDGLIINGVVYHPIIKTPIQARGVDLLLVATKYDGLKTILDDIEIIVDEHTTVISLLNGVDSEQIIAQRIGAQHMLHAMMRISAERKGNDIFFNPDITGGMFFGELLHTEPTCRVQEVLDLFAPTRVNHHFVPDIMKALWVKYAGNVSNNLPQAIFGVGVGVFVTSDHACHIAQHMWDEVAALAATHGINIGPFNPAAWVERMNARFSTLQDLDNGRHTEVDMFAGAVVRMSREKGLEAPYCEFAYHCIKVLEEKNDGKFEF